ncbi:MAG: hypothetical protein HY359_16335 [Candidatus Rokubacteria bacterium]|nr:hypothetical protein [Candidatus Rokubacteria bacterium]
MATKRGKRSGSSTKSKSRAKPKATAKPGAKPARSANPQPERRVTRPAVAPARREAAPPTLLERAKALRDAIQRSKLTAPDPWGYAGKARPWFERAERLLDRISAGVETAELRKGVEALAAEVEADRDFQEARRRA